MGGLLHLVQRGWPGRAVAPPSPLLAVPNVTAHPSTASVLITVLLYDGALLCDFNVAIKGLSTRPKAGTLCDGAVCLICLFMYKGVPYVSSAVKNLAQSWNLWLRRSLTRSVRKRSTPVFIVFILSS